MKLQEVMQELESLGSAQTVKTFRRHGATGDMFGVKVGDMKKLLKQIKGDQELAMELWDTGNSDAMYLAGLLADGQKMTQKQLEQWAKSAHWYMLSEYAVPFVAAEHPKAFKIARKWIQSRSASVATSGWTTYAAALSVRPDTEIDLKEVLELLKKAEDDMAGAESRVRYCMNGFVISVASYVEPMLKEAKATAGRIGAVEVDMGDTSCKVPDATQMITKIETLGRVGKKRKTVKC